MSDVEVVNPRRGVFGRMPRALQWALLTVIFLGLFWVWDQYVRPLADKWDKQVSAIESRVKDIRATETISSKFPGLQEVAVTLGPVDTPTTEKEAEAAFVDAVNRVLQKNGATNQSTSYRSRGKLSKTALMSITGGTKRIDRYTGDLKFDATPKATAAIIADLESDPDIEAVDSVRMTRDTNGKVKVHLTVETWVISSEASKGEAL